jgi:hypothetical protein
MKGHSLQRQLEATEKYCHENGLELDRSLTLQDLGLSGYTGAHRTKGALGTFLQMVESKKIPPESTLIVESLDRLSREEVLWALNQFTSLITAGITIVTLADRKVYSQKSIKDNWADLIVSITIMARSNEESETKSKRGQSVWEYKRQQAADNGQKLSARGPLWVEYDRKKKEFRLLPEPCKAIETIYRMRLSGKGKTKIVREMNQNPNLWKPPISKRNRTGGWQEPYVVKILSDPIVIGTYQPRKRQGDSKKAIAGEAIKNYYPAAISEELYYQVKDLRKASKKAGGQTRKASNLFVHLVRCGHCGTALHYINDGKNQYLRCDAARRSQAVNDKQCPSRGVRYDEVEQIIFDNLEELDVSEILPNQNEKLIHLNDLKRKQTAYSQKENDLIQGIENISESIFSTKDANVRAILEKRMSKAIAEKDNLKKSLDSLKTEIENASKQGNQLAENLETTKKVFQLLKDTKDEKKQLDLRLQLRGELKKLIEKIDIYSLQQPYQAEKEIDAGVYQIMRSRSIDKIRITFNAGMSESKKRVILLKTNREYI